MSQRRLKGLFICRQLLNGGFIIVICILQVIFSSRASAQVRYDWRTNVDMMVERADSLSLKSQQTFYLNRVIKVDNTFKNDRTVRETWYYTLTDGKIPIFQIRYLVDSIECNETYYLNNGSLVCFEQYESAFYSPYDEITWSKVLFFDNNVQKLHINIGHRRSIDQETKNPSDAIEIF